jgi:acetoin utilization deacetylase AcuC-like enzyme
LAPTVGTRLGVLAVLLAVAASASLQTAPQVAPPARSTISARPTGFLYDDIYLQHLSGNSGHPERPERLTAIWNGLQKAGLIHDMYRLARRRATDNELALVHERSYIQLVRRELANVRGYKELSTGDTLVSADSLDAALSASGGVLNGVDAVMTGRVKNAFCAVRPPGHHAGPARGMGFCIFNNVAIAARYVQKTYGLQRVLIVDQDYHHGNGTQDIFYEDGSVFYFSTHHYGAYPGTGAASETGRGQGAGHILNVPLPPGAGDEQVLQAFQTQLVPAARAFKPDFILISAGFDAMRNDGLGVFDVTPQGFAAIARVVVNLANELCQGRLVSVLEGGYRLDGLADSVAAHVRVLQGK